ncbi:hypothetical protein CH371_15505 [Leptospira wolffii]|uniref:TIGR04255 family protein n=1 Tax=Leptospira wolffii TaxID=409998 RepID=A0A2M9Z909_9LEPT|nr:hypothetical protein [Leptospira wolffii]PJZ64908.1 hypothetical protein CH371_15505 [Leptospira wolffii]
MEFRIENSQIAVFFPRIPTIRRKAFELEELLSARFLTPFSMIQVPDEAPEDIPRIQAQTKNGHTTLTISQSNISLITNFNGGFESDWSKVNDYLIKNFDLIYEIARKVGASSFLYTGFTVNLFFPFKNEGEVMQHINRIFFPDKRLLNLYEFNFRFVQRKGDVYFVNYMLSSTVKYLSQGIPLRPVPAYLIPSEFGITLNIDINDRYGSNFEREYLSNQTNGTKLIEYMNEVVGTKIEKLMKEGDINV